MVDALASVIVPAHNEGRVIDRLLADLFDGETPFAVVVACNGCSDDTAERARSWAERAHPSTLVVLDLPAPSKNAAIRSAEAVAPGFPRIVLDADVRVSPRALRAVAQALPDGRAGVARPPLAYDTAASSGWVRRFYRARERTPSLMSAMWGAGCYAVSDLGRARWAQLPDDVADDLYVDSRFAADEKAVVGDDPVVVTPPRTTRALVHTLRRVYSAPPASRATHEQGTAAVASASTRTLRSLVEHNVGTWEQRVDLAAYLAAAVLARLWRGRFSSWHRDDTTR